MILIQKTLCLLGAFLIFSAVLVACETDPVFPEGDTDESVYREMNLLTWPCVVGADEYHVRVFKEGIQLLYNIVNNGNNFVEPNLNQDTRYLCGDYTWTVDAFAGGTLIQQVVDTDFTVFGCRDPFKATITRPTYRAQIRDSSFIFSYLNYDPLNPAHAMYLFKLYPDGRKEYFLIKYIPHNNAWAETVTGLNYGNYFSIVIAANPFGSTKSHVTSMSFGKPVPLSRVVSGDHQITWRDLTPSHSRAYQVRIYTNTGDFFYARMEPRLTAHISGLRKGHIISKPMEHGAFYWYEVRAEQNITREEKVWSPFSRLKRFRYTGP